ncbi:MAG: GatB/YqeY domain-containing protein [Candidatus Kerfeldbacteria bacterium]|nr:GatB/YqeY domain-containing protein [Candidatus Kerfeldbacteria bacterium]
MSLQQTILADLTHAMKERDADTVSVLRMIKSSFILASKEAGGSEELSDEIVLALLRKEAKKRQESATAFRQGNRVDLAEKEEKELSLIERYLPAQLSEDEIMQVVARVAAEVGTQNFGALMGAVMKKLHGQADGNTVRTLVQKYTAQ